MGNWDITTRNTPALYHDQLAGISIREL